MTRALLAAALLLSGCTAAQQSLEGAALTAAGVSPGEVATITADTAAAGQLFCLGIGGWMAVKGATVTNATASAVADACPSGSAPGPLPTGAVAVVVTVGQSLIAALNASKGGA